MRNALLFDDILHFTDFVRVYGSNASSSRGFTLYHVRDPERPARTQLALVGFRKRKGWSFADTPLAVSELQVEEQDDKLIGRSEGQERQELDLQGSSRGLTLLELISLSPWRTEVPLTKVLFWLRKPQLMPRIVADSFKLGNDRIQFAPIEHEGKQALLLRIESPSYYLLQWCQEQHANDIDLFYSPCDDLYVEWGFQHPMEDLWRRSHKPRQPEWLIFKADEERKHVTPPTWQDIYKATEFSLDFPLEQVWSEASEAPATFTLPLRFEPRSRPIEPELWMLEEDEQHLLERLLSLVDEQDLKTLLISIQESEAGKRRFFIREKHVGEGRKFLDFKGKRFASYKGFHNLMLPVSVELQPQLRRDQYRDLFALKSGELTILHAEYDESAHKMTLARTQLLRLRENSFEPITKLIDYIVEASAETLTNILKSTLFDFSEYAKAPRRADLMSRPKLERSTKGDKDNKDDKDNKATKDDKDAKDAPKVRKTIKKKSLVSKKKTSQDDEDDDEITIEPSELELEEAHIERTLVQEGQSSTHWAELAGIKAMLQKWMDAVMASFEGMWLLPAGDDYNEQRAELTEQLDQFLSLTGTPAQRLKRAHSQAKKNNAPLAVAAYILHGQDEGDDRIDEWLQEATLLLRQSELRLRKKERWLLWREIFLRNGDIREQARVREDILKDINENGITNHDIPLFIQERIFQERWLQQSEGDASNEVGAAFRNLELICEAVETFPLPRLKAPGLAILARAFGRIGHHPKAKELLDKARKGIDQLELDTQAWIQLYTFQAISFQSKNESKALEKEFHDLCKQLETKSKSHFNNLKKMEASLEERKELENLSEYLSKENKKRLFPSNTSGANAGIKSRIEAIESSFQAGELDKVSKEVLGVLEYIQSELTGKKKDPDFRTLAWLLDSAIATLSKLKWGHEGRDLIQAFEKFVSTIPQQPPENSAKLSDFYFTVLHLAMSEGLVALGSESIAMQHLQELLGWTFDRDLVPLDYVDMCSKALDTIEVAQLKNRQDPLRLIMQGMQRQVSSGQSSNNYDNPSFAAIALKLLDQTVEVALSKEKLTLGLYKQYTDQDELLIRERIFTENISA